jgi:quercetin dioxygenase-like cupin family protein
MRSIKMAEAGWGQQWGEPIQEIRLGDVVWIPLGVKHCHGATGTTAMTHIAIQNSTAGLWFGWNSFSDEQ